MILLKSNSNKISFKANLIETDINKANIIPKMIAKTMLKMIQNRMMLPILIDMVNCLHLLIKITLKTSIQKENVLSLFYQKNRGYAKRRGYIKNIAQTPQTGYIKMINWLNETLMSARRSFTRNQTHKWFVVVILGLIVGQEHVGVTSFIRELWLNPIHYHASLHFFRSTAWKLETLRNWWIETVLKSGVLFTENGMPIIPGNVIKLSPPPK